MSASFELLPDLIAEVRLYAAEDGSPGNPIRAGFRCPCAATTNKPSMMHSAELLVGSEPLHAGESRRIGFAFLTPEGADAMREAGTFFIWNGRFFGEATVVP